MPRVAVRRERGTRRGGERRRLVGADGAGAPSDHVDDVLDVDQDAGEEAVARVGGDVLAQRPLVDHSVDPHPIGLLVVDGEVLQRGADAARLHTLHHRRGKLTREALDANNKAMADVLKVKDQNQIPELNVYQCGTYTMHSLEEAQEIARHIIERDVRVNSNDELALPKEKLQELHI
mgnify:CR=1 FL=1